MISQGGEMGGPAEKRAGEKSSFNLTCSLLAQYLKEKGGFGDLSLGMARALDVKAKPDTPRTMNLLPGLEPLGAGAADDSAENAATATTKRTERSQAAQMTIFYGGKVLVFDNFPADRAKELMAMAGKGSSPAPANPTPYPAAASCPAPLAPRNAATPASSSGNNPIAAAPVAAPAAPAEVRPQRPPQAPVASDLPIARRASLNRFLEKRKDRINAKAPYQVQASPDNVSSSGSPVEKAPLGKAEGKKPWLGLAPLAPSDPLPESLRGLKR